MNTVAKHDDLELPAALKRTTNAKGVTLSAGVDQPVVATGAKTGKGSKRDKKAAKAVETAPVVETAKSTPVTAAPALNADGTPVEKVKRSIVPMRFKEKYKGHGGTCGDDMAMELKAATTTRPTSCRARQKSLRHTSRIYV